MERSHSYKNYLSFVLTTAALLSAIQLNPLSARAAMTAEDADEFLIPQPETDGPKNYQPDPNLNPILKGTKGEWSYEFELIDPHGNKTILAESNKDALFPAASTFKIFTSWWAFKNKFKSNSYLSKMLRESINSWANRIYTKLGGASAMKDFYQSQALPINDDNFQPNDGAGLTVTTKTTAHLEIQLLEKIMADPSFHQYKQLMVQPGAQGTLHDRLTELNGNLFAKTGTLNGEAALAGYLETNKGTMVFAILSTDLGFDVDRNRKRLKRARDKVDALVRAYAQ